MTAMRFSIAELRRHRSTRFLAAAAIGAIGAGILTGLTSQGYLHAAVVTGAGYTGETTEAGPEGQLLAIGAWLLIGSLAGALTHSWAGLAGLWAGALTGSLLGLAADPQGNILWLDVIVTLVGVTVFLVPAYAIGVGIALYRERLDPDGSGHRPAPPPLWTRGRREQRQPAPASTSAAAQSGSATQPAPPSSYARPRPPGSE
jgi:hypothetical protein